MRSSEIDTKYRCLLDEIKATLHDPSGAALLAGHLQDLPGLLQGLDAAPQAVGRIEIVVNRSGQVVSQNKASAQRLGMHVDPEVRSLQSWSAGLRHGQKTLRMLPSSTML